MKIIYWNHMINLRKRTPLTAQIFQTSEILEESTVTETETIESEYLKLLNSFKLEVGIKNIQGI